MSTTFLANDFEVLTHQERVLLEALLSARLLTREHAYDLLWPMSDPPEAYDNHLTILIHRIRRKLNVEIISTYRLGYRMEADEVNRITALGARGHFHRRKKEIQLRLDL